MKKIISILLAISVCAALTACGNSANTDETTDTNSSESAMEETQAKVTAKRTPKQISSDISETTKSRPENSDEILESFYDLVANDVENTLSNLYTEYDQLLSEVDTYDKYLSNSDKIEAFYDKVYDTHNNLCIRMREYSIDYVNAIISSDMTYDDMYDELEELYDTVYDEAGDNIYDGVYDGLLEDMYDDYYDGILDIDYDDLDDYKEWSNAHSDEYKLWSNTRSDVYGDWSDFRSDVYGFWSDMRSALYNDDIDRATKKIEKFQKSIDKLSGIAAVDANNVTANAVTEKEETTSAGLNGIRPEFKEAMDSYEAFYDEYCDIMKKYMENPTDLTIFSQYSECLEKAEEFDEKIDAIDEDSLTPEEDAYYLEVTGRVLAKMLEIYQ